jgi:hypothetical protein
VVKLDPVITPDIVHGPTDLRNGPPIRQAHADIFSPCFFTR